MATSPESPAGKRERLAKLAAKGRESAQLTWRTIGLVYRSWPAATILLGALTVAVAALPLGIAWVGKEIVDAVVAGSREDTIRWVVTELAIVAVHAVVQRGIGLTRELLGERLGLDINNAILDKAQALELRHFEDGKFYDSLTRARREASYRPVSVVTEGFQLIQNALTFTGYVALIVGYSPIAALVLLAAAVPSTVAEVVFSRSAFRLFNWRTPESRVHNYIEYVLASVGYVKELRLFGLGPLFLGRYRSIGEKFFREDRKLAVRRSFWALLLSVLATIAFYGCYMAMALAAARKAISIGEMTLYIVAFRQGQQALSSLLSGIGGLYEHTLYMSNYFAYQAIPTRELSARAPADAVAAPVREEGVRFEKVGFRYPVAEKEEGDEPPAGHADSLLGGNGAGGDGEKKPLERWALRDVSVFVPRGQSIALVGQNGAGKTTFVKLLARLYEPTEGRVLVDGKDILEWDPVALRARMAVIFQDFNEYQLDVRENIAVGSAAHQDDAPRIDRAARSGGADEVIKELPQGLATKLGKWAHDGVELSGGQWQKVALARAFMREEADILVLDEPTASLDAEAEHAVFERFRALAKGRTTILISHRFSTVRMADRILVLEHGKVAEDGSHEELLKAGGKYARLFTLQAQGYV